MGKTNKDAPVMLSITQTAKYLNLPVHFVRLCVLDGRAVSVRAGSKYLVNLNRFIEFLNKGDVQQNVEKLSQR